MRRGLRAACAIALPGLLAPAIASAHGSVAGFGSFGSGFLHPLVEPALLLAVVATALLIGQYGFKETRPAMAALACGLVLGLTAAGLGHAMPAGAPLLATTAAVGLGVGTGRRWPPAVYGAAAALTGLGIGLGAEPDAAGAARLWALAGTFIGACIWVADGALAAQALKRPWGRILVRVLASWVAAAALLALALRWAPGHLPAHPTPPAGASTTSAGR